MKQNTNFHFLLELLLDIVMFTVCSVVFVSLFLSAKQKNTLADVQYRSSVEVSNLAEELQQNPMEETCIQKEGYVVSIEKQENVYTIIAIDDNGNTLEKIRVRKMGGKYAQNG